MMFTAPNSHRSKHAAISAVSLRLILLLSCLVAHPVLAEINKATAIHDLRYGEALYYFYQKKYFSAITHLMYAKKYASIRQQDGKARILLGRLYQSYGLGAESRRIFTGLLKNDIDGKTRDQAWYYLGKSYYQGGEYDQAGNALNRITGTLPPTRNEERLNLLANIHLHQGKQAQAMTVLENLDSHSIWKHYAQFNLGVALIKSGETEKGQDLLENSGGITARNDERAALKDRANLALGFSYIQQQKSKEAIKYLKTIRLVGPFSNKALLGLGWAYNLAGDDRHALSAWRALAKRDPIDPAVQEALLAIPYSTDALGAPGRALTEYEQATKIYTREQTRLKTAIKTVRRGEIEKILRANSRNPEIITPLEIKKTTPAHFLPYLSRLLAGYKFQTACKNYRDLFYLRRVLADWQARLPALQTILRQRKQSGAALPSTRKTKISLAQDWREGPKNFRAYSSQIKRRQRKIKHLNVRLDALLRAQAHYLQSLALAKLHEHQQQLKHYRIRAQYNISLLLDKLSADNDRLKEDRQ